jgi:phytanoyl-CoA hydroxylase
MTRHFDCLAAISPHDRSRFAADGFLIVERLLDGAQIEDLRGRFPLLFAGKFDTGIYPDEWYWREGMSLPDVTRHMANAWKADLTVARLVLSESIGRFAAELCGWRGTRLGQDTIWWKAPKTKPIAYHQDTSFMDFLEPPSTLTCWVTLDDTHRDAGTLEYAPGSHKWPLTRLPDAFHGADDYRAQMKAAAKAAGVEPPDPFFIEVPAGSCVFHCGETWHGSAANMSADRMRRAIGIHMLPEDVRFSDRAGGYIYRRYQRTGDPALDESYFPVLWSRSGRRTKWIESYCESGLRHAG